MEANIEIGSFAICSREKVDLNKIDDKQCAYEVITPINKKLKAEYEFSLIHCSDLNERSTTHQLKIYLIDYPATEFVRYFILHYAFQC